MTQKTALLATFANTSIGDLGRTSSSLSAEFDLQWSWRLVLHEQSRLRKVQTQFFFIYAWRLVGLSRTAAAYAGVLSVMVQGMQDPACIHTHLT